MYVSGLKAYNTFILLDDVPISSDRPFVLCDYGCADGGTSHDLMSGIIGETQNIFYKTSDRPAYKYFKKIYNKITFGKCGNH